MANVQAWTQDVRYAVRRLRKSPGFAATAVLTLALGIGATTAIFTLVYQVLLRSLPVAHPEQLYKLGKGVDCCVTSGLQKNWNLFSNELYEDLRDHTPGTAGMAAVDAGATTTTVRKAGSTDNPQPLQLRFVSGNYFSLLGVQTFAGRLLTPEDDREGAPPVAVISYPLWKVKFNADPHLVGSTLLLTGHPVTVVGVTAESFLGERDTQDPPGLWAPLAYEPVMEPDRTLSKFPASDWLDILVRVPDAAQVPATQLAVQTELRHWITANRALQAVPIADASIAKQTTELAPAAGGINDLRDQYGQSLHLLLAIAGFVLLIACANLANLMLVRGMARRQELAVRSALGAPRARLIRQMLIEALLLSLAGGLAAVALAFAGTRSILALAMPTAETSTVAATPSLPVLGFALLVSLATGVLFGIAPAWIASRASPVEALRGANRSTRDASALPQRMLIIFQAALSLCLLSTAGLLITSLRHLEHQDFHFDSTSRLILYVDPQSAGYSPARLPGLYQQLDQNLGHLPGVTGLAYGLDAPMASNNWSDAVVFPGERPTDQSSKIAALNAVSAGYFSAVGSRILRGRGITEEDTATSRHVAVVNQTFADKFLKGKDAIGANFGPNPKLPTEYEIVGVAEDTKYTRPSEPVQPMFFTPLTQSVPLTVPREISNEQAKHVINNIVVAYHGDAASMSSQVRAALRGIDPNLAVLQMNTYTQQLSLSFTQQELVVRLTSLFGLLALVLASVGLYGVTAYTVARRTGEIGIRMALGATRTSVLGMIVRSAVVQVGIGLLIGLPLAYGAGRLVASTLYQTGAFQPGLLLAVVGVLLVAALAAALVPARRAASIEPTQALRAE